MSNINYYSILKVSEKATPIEIKNAYILMVKKYHPDKGGNPIIFKYITTAYEILSDPIKKKEYDLSIKEGEDDDDSIMDFHLKLKDAFMEYTTTRKLNSENNKTIEESKKELDDDIEKIIKQTGYKPKNKYTDKEKQEQMKQIEEKIDELKMEREQEECEIANEKLFDDENFSNNDLNRQRFNALFDKINEQNQNLYESRHNETQIISINEYNTPFTFLDETKNNNPIIGTLIDNQSTKQYKVSRKDLDKIKVNNKKEEHINNNDYDRYMERRNKETDELSKIALQTKEIDTKILRQQIKDEPIKQDELIKIFNEQKNNFNFDIIS